MVKQDVSKHMIIRFVSDTWLVHCNEIVYDRVATKLRFSNCLTFPWFPKNFFGISLIFSTGQVLPFPILDRKLFLRNASLFSWHLPNFFIPWHFRISLISFLWQPCNIHQYSVWNKDSYTEIVAVVLCSWPQGIGKTFFMKVFFTMTSCPRSLEGGGGGGGGAGPFGAGRVISELDFASFPLDFGVLSSEFCDESCSILRPSLLPNP